MEREFQSASVPSCLPGALMQAQHAAPMPHHHGRAWRPHHPLHRAGYKEWWSGVRALLQPSVWPRHRRRQRASPGPAPVLEATWAPWTPEGTASLCSSSGMPVPLIRVRTCGRRLRLPWVRCVFSPYLESVYALVCVFVSMRCGSVGGPVQRAWSHHWVSSPRTPRTFVLAAAWCDCRLLHGGAPLDWRSCARGTPVSCCNVGGDGCCCGNCRTSMLRTRYGGVSVVFLHPSARYPLQRTRCFQCSSCSSSSSSSCCCWGSNCGLNIAHLRMNGYPKPVAGRQCSVEPRPF